jgi:alpha-L-rhamnosidase
MIKNPTAPSYRALIDDGLTTLPENLSEPYGSLNHHFWGDVSALMIEYFGGIRINPTLSGADTVEIRPVFPNDLTYVEAYHKSVKGMIKTHWQKNDGKIELSLEIPSEITGKIVSPTGYLLDGKNSVEAKTGKYIFEKTSG